MHITRLPNMRSWQSAAQIPSGYYRLLCTNAGVFIFIALSIVVRSQMLFQRQVDQFPQCPSGLERVDTRVQNKVSVEIADGVACVRHDVMPPVWLIVFRVHQAITWLFWPACQFRAPQAPAKGKYLQHVRLIGLGSQV